MQSTVLVEEAAKLERSYLTLLEQYYLSIKLWRQFDEVGIDSMEGLLELTSVGTPSETLDAAMTALDELRAFRAADDLP